LTRLIARRAEDGVSVRIVLGDPDSIEVARRGAEEGIGESMAARIRNALALLSPLAENQTVRLRLHSTVLYNSIYRADDELLVNSHIYGAGAPSAPILHLQRSGESPMVSAYVASFERVWGESRDVAL
jgi:hypothetical protein